MKIISRDREVKHLFRLGFPFRNRKVHVLSSIYVKFLEIAPRAFPERSVVSRECAAGARSIARESNILRHALPSKPFYQFSTSLTKKYEDIFFVANLIRYTFAAEKFFLKFIVEE